MIIHFDFFIVGWYERSSWHIVWHTTTVKKSTLCKCFIIPSVRHCQSKKDIVQVTKSSLFFFVKKKFRSKCDSRYSQISKKYRLDAQEVAISTTRARNCAIHSPRFTISIICVISNSRSDRKLFDNIVWRDEFVCNSCKTYHNFTQRYVSCTTHSWTCFFLKKNKFFYSKERSSTMLW